jgi:phosphoglycerol transferase MdoB-like AlkP superfamily enzyme
LKVSDSVTLAFIHVPLFLWCLFGLSFASFETKNTDKWIEFIRFNGELLIMTGLILIAGGMLTGVTVALFSAIKMDIQKFYIEYVVVFGGVAAPIVAYYLIRLYPTLTNKIAPVIAKVFTPLVLITLVVYLVSLIFSSSSILENRDLLLVFNIMLLAVMAIIVFSVAELDKSKERNVNVLILFVLAVLAIVTNAIALVAIITRVTYGLTPNRTVVLVSNILIFVNLILLAKSLYHCYLKGKSLDTVERVVADYLKVYALWTIVVIFILPFVFGMK